MTSPACWERQLVGCIRLNQDRGVGSTWSGQAELSHEPRARVVIWPPLRLAWMRCERGSVSVVLPTGFRDGEQAQGGNMRVIGLDVHRSFAAVAYLEDGLPSGGGRGE